VETFSIAALQISGLRIRTTPTMKFRLVVATSVGGNAICFHARSGNVVWADHTSFEDEQISFKDRASGQWQYFYEYTAENVQEAVTVIATDMESFLVELLSNRLNAQLDSLDQG
jgi:hypothetical protein